jgi:transposase
MRMAAKVRLRDVLKPRKTIIDYTYDFGDSWEQRLKVCGGVRKHRQPAARTIARLMTIGRNTLSKAETVTITAIETDVPRLVKAREMIAAFQAMVRNKTDAGLAVWIDAARQSLVASFANGVAKDEAAVRAAITLPWCNGQTEGQITKLKLVKRQMYGRARIDLLQARMIGVPT